MIYALLGTLLLGQPIWVESGRGVRIVAASEASARPRCLDRKNATCFFSRPCDLTLRAYPVPARQLGEHSREAHLSTTPNTSQAHPRFPCAHGHQERPQGP